MLRFAPGSFQYHEFGSFTSEYRTRSMCFKFFTQANARGLIFELLQRRHIADEGRSDQNVDDVHVLF